MTYHPRVLAKMDEVLAKGAAMERLRIIGIIRRERWEVYTEDYTYDAPASIENLIALIEEQPK